MLLPDSPLSSETWLRGLFACKTVQNGRVIRHKRRDVERMVGMAPFMVEIN